MSEVLRRYVEDGMDVVEYTKDGKTVSSVVRTRNDIAPRVETPSQLDTLLSETQYQTALLEMQILGGI